jgi:tetratricopeptide (TPR) repeat protein
MNRSKLLNFAWLALALVLWARPAAADDKSEARALFTEATRNYDLNDYARALTLFKQAYLKYEDPVFIYNIGQCERQLGDKNAAVKSYRSYLRKAGDAPNRDSVRRLIAQLEAAIAEESKAQHSPPEGPLRPDGATPTATPAAGGENVTATPTTSQAPASESLTAQHQPSEKPVYKKPWFWGVVGGAAAVVVAGVVVGVVVGGASHDPGAPSIGVVK